MGGVAGKEGADAPEVDVRRGRDGAAEKLVFPSDFALDEKDLERRLGCADENLLSVVADVGVRIGRGDGHGELLDALGLGHVLELDVSGPAGSGHRDALAAYPLVVGLERHLDQLVRLGAGVCHADGDDGDVLYEDVLRAIDVLDGAVGHGRLALCGPDADGEDGYAEPCGCGDGVAEAVILPVGEEHDARGLRSAEVAHHAGEGVGHVRAPARRLLRRLVRALHFFGERCEAIVALLHYLADGILVFLQDRLERPVPAGFRRAVLALHRRRNVGKDDGAGGNLLDVHERQPRPQKADDDEREHGHAEGGEDDALLPRQRPLRVGIGPHHQRRHDDERCDETEDLAEKEDGHADEDGRA